MTEQWLTGQPFADLGFEVDGAATTLSAWPGLRVVDLWATWCGPCVESLPHIAQVADAYADRGVTVIALSVDGEQDDMDQWLRKHKEVTRSAAVLGWAGRGAMEAAHISGIPAVFIIDADGLIAGFYSGSGPSDTRLEQRLDALLGEPRPPE